MKAGFKGLPEVSPTNKKAKDPLVGLKFLTKRSKQQAPTKQPRVESDVPAVKIVNLKPVDYIKQSTIENDSKLSFLEDLNARNTEIRLHELNNNGSTYKFANKIAVLSRSNVETSVAYDPDPASKSTLSAVDMNYLNSVGSVTDLYADYVNREKLFKGLNSVSLEKLDTSVSLQSQSADRTESPDGLQSPSVTLSTSWYWGNMSTVNNEGGGGNEVKHVAAQPRPIQEEEEEDSQEVVGETDPGRAGGAGGSSSGAQEGIGIYWSADTSALYQDAEAPARGDSAPSTADLGLGGEEMGLEGRWRSGSVDSLSSMESDSDAVHRSIDQVNNNNADKIPAGLRGSNKMPSAILSKYFQRSVNALRSALETVGDIDYVRNPLHTRHILRQLNDHLQLLRDAQEFGRNQVVIADREYDSLQSDIEKKRRDSALRVALCYEKMTKLHSKFAEKYLAAQIQFEESRRTQFSSTVTKHITSNRRMDKIQEKANERLVQCGESLQLLQNNEAILLKNLRCGCVCLCMILIMYVCVCREAEFTLLESIKHWRPLYLQWSEKAASRVTLLASMRVHIASLKIQRLFRDQYFQPMQFLADHLGSGTTH